MKYIKHFQCTECGTTYPVDQPMNLCPNDNRPVQLVLDMDAIKRDYDRDTWIVEDEHSMWRYAGLLPFDVRNEKDQISSLGEGFTPLININDYALVNDLGLKVDIKDEGQAHPGYGANPTGSFKDRGMSMVTTMAKHFGLNKLAVPTQGNAGDSLSEYGHANGFDVSVIMPDDTPMPIMGKVAAYAQMYKGMSLSLVKGTIREAGEAMKRDWLPQGYFNCATFQEPGWRIEGKKTMGLELAHPNPSDPDGLWVLPDVVMYPTGGGTGILGMWKAFDEMEALGIIGPKRPRIIAIQSDQNAPVVDAFEQGLDDTVPTDGGDTLATGLNVPGGVGHKAVLRILRASQGGGVKVSEADMAKHTNGIYLHNGMWISPEGGAAVAAIPAAMQKGWIKADDHVVCFNTGSAEKYLPAMRELVQVMRD